MQHSENWNAGPADLAYLLHGFAYRIGNCGFCFLDQVFSSTSAQVSATVLVPASVVIVLLGNMSLI